MIITYDSLHMIITFSSKMLSFASFSSPVFASLLPPRQQSLRHTKYLAQVIRYQFSGLFKMFEEALTAAGMSLHL